MNGSSSQTNKEKSTFLDGQDGHLFSTVLKIFENGFNRKANSHYF